jgi:nuclear GTP-binding protein
MSEAPSVDAKGPVAGTGDAILSSFAPEFDLDALFGEADADALSEAKEADELRGAVRMDMGEPMDDEATGRVRLMGERSDAEDDAVAMQASDDENNIVAPSLVPSLGRRKRALPIGDDDDDDDDDDAMRVGGKRVTFAPTPRSQAAKLFTDNDVEAPPVPLAKKAKKAAKERRKAVRRAEHGAADGMRVDEAASTTNTENGIATASLGDLDLATGALTVEDDGPTTDDTPYQFSDYFSKVAAPDDSDDEL